MKRTVLFLYTFVLLSIITSGCRSEFEKVRASADPEAIYAKAIEYYDQKEFLRSQILIELILNSFRARKEAEQLRFMYAYTHYHLGKYILASYYFENFADTYTNSTYREEAKYMTALSYYNLSPTYRLDQTYSNKAIEAFQSFVNTFPQSDKVEKCNSLIDQLRRKLEKKAYVEAELYFNLRQYQSAVHSFENLLKDFPESPEAQEVRYMIVKSHYLLASNSIPSKKMERYEDVVKTYDNFRRKYPQSSYDKELESIYKNTLKKIKEIN